MEEMAETLASAIGRRIELIKGGVTFKDKFVIFIYMLLSLLFIPFDKKKKRLNMLFSDVITENKDGIFFCRKHTPQIWGIDTFKEQKSRKYFDLIKKGTFVDAGANIGRYSVRVASNLKGKGRVVAIEPEPEVFKTLVKNIKLNRLDNTTPINTACFSKDTSLKFYITKTLGQHSLYGKGKNIKIKARKLDSILKELNINDANLIKIDVEGAEYEVIKGAEKTISKQKPMIIFESFDEKRTEKIKDFLRKRGYKIKQISNRNYFAEQETLKVMKSKLNL